MDTDNLSTNTYNAVIKEAEKFHRNLMLHFGGLAGESKTEEEFLTAAETSIKNWLEDWKTDDVVQTIFYENPPDTTEFINVLKTIRDNIVQVRRIPLKKREFPNL